MPATATKKVTKKKAASVGRGRKPATRPAAKKKAAQRDLAASYNEFKEFEGHQYSGMKVGRSHKWYYDKGEWRETKITPDLWEISYAVTKRRAGHAPEGSGVPVGTAYHWYILAHQHVSKLNANDYTTALSGLKFKLAHKRATKETWSASLKAQRKRLVAFLKEMIGQLEQEAVPIEFEHKGKMYKGEALPYAHSCHDGVCDELDITLNNEHLGIIRRSDSGWKMKYVKDQKLVDAIGQEIFVWYE